MLLHEFRNKLAEMGHEFIPSEAHEIMKTLETAMDTITIDDYLWVQSLSPTEVRAEAKDAGMSTADFQDFLDVVSHLYETKAAR